MSDGAFQPSDWKDIRLVAFDVDGTLYRQRPLRLRMARDLVLHALTKADLAPIAVLGKFRRIRERLGDERADGFAAALIAETAAASGRSPEAVQARVAEGRAELNGVIVQIEGGRAAAAERYRFVEDD